MKNEAIILNEEEVKKLDYCDSFLNKAQEYYGSGARIEQVILIISND